MGWHCIKVNWSWGIMSGQWYRTSSNKLSTCIFFLTFIYFTKHTIEKKSSLRFLITNGLPNRGKYFIRTNDLLGCRFSICNTVKCGVAVWLSVPIFGNVITLWSGFGSFLVIAGVIMYQKARSYERRSLKDPTDPVVDQVLPSSVDVIHSINSWTGFTFSIRTWNSRADLTGFVSFVLFVDVVGSLQSQNLIHFCLCSFSCRLLSS